MFKRKYWATILFKSGNRLRLKVYEMQVKTNLSEVTSLSWVLVSGRLLEINVNQIEAIHTKKAWF